MPFDQSFQRSSGLPVPPNPPALGSDPDPSMLTGAAAVAYAARDNVFTFQLVQAGPQPRRLAVAAVYEGLGSPGAAAVALYLYDPQETGRWLIVPGTATFALGQVLQVEVPVVQSVLALTWQLALVPSVASPATGIYTFTAGLTV